MSKYFVCYSVCTLPFELCKYGKKASECKKFLMEIAPTKVEKYHPSGSNESQPKEEAEKAADEPEKEK